MWNNAKIYAFNVATAFCLYSFFYLVIFVPLPFHDHKTIEHRSRKHWDFVGRKFQEFSWLEKYLRKEENCFLFSFNLFFFRIQHVVHLKEN